MSSKVSGMNTLLSVSARTNNPEPGFQLINQRITHSTINDNIWASLQNAQIQALKTLDQRPAEKFAQLMYETRYADDRTKLLQENQIAQFTAADALAADRQLFSSPADITFVIVGNVAEDKLVALITRYLGSIKHSDSPLAAGKPLTRATDNASVTVKNKMNLWHRFHSGSVMIPGHLLIWRRVWRSMLLTSHWQKIYALIFVNRHLGHTAFLLASRLILRLKISVICWLLLVNQNDMMNS